MREKNRFGISRGFNYELNEELIVFISYKRSSDWSTAYECAERLESVRDITYWLDEEDECIAGAQDPLQTANCIEKGLDDASALLGIIGPETFKSSWVPYEIGGARGRHRFKRFTSEDYQPIPHPLIAHFIHKDVNISEVPEYVALGTPLVSLDEVSAWAESVVVIQGISTYQMDFSKAHDIRRSYGVESIYERNTEHLRADSLNL